MEVVELSGPPGQLCAVSLFMIDPTLGIIGRGAGRLDHWITRRCCPVHSGQETLRHPPTGLWISSKEGANKVSVGRLERRAVGAQSALVILYCCLITPQPPLWFVISGSK